jgi:hypothetical protein
VSDPVDLFQGALQSCTVFLRCSCRTQNNLQFTFQNGEGSLKFMGGIGTEAADLAECSIQAGEHLVQGFGQIVQFIACSCLIHTLAKVLKRRVVQVFRANLRRWRSLRESNPCFSLERAAS